MSAQPPAGTALDDLMGRLDARDRDGAIDLLRRLRTQGATPDQVITDFLAPAQRRVGELWQTDAWSVAQEHAATGIVDIALAELELTNDVLPSRGRVVVTCAEGEWHALPARMLAEQLRRLAWSVTFLGSSTPAVHLGRLLRSVEVVAVAVSCSMPIFLFGAQRSIDAAHREGLPVVAGGAGFGCDDKRARVLGADGWAPTARIADEHLSAWAERRPPLRRSATGAAALPLAAVRADVVENALLGLSRRLPAVCHDDREAVDRTREELGYTMQFVEAALLTHDVAVFDDFLTWQGVVLESRGIAPDLVRASLDALADALPPGQPPARALLRRHRDG